MQNWNAFQWNAFRLKCPLHCEIDGTAADENTGGADTCFSAAYSHFKDGAVIREVNGAGVFEITDFADNNFEETANGYIARFFVVHAEHAWVWTAQLAAIANR